MDWFQKITGFVEVSYAETQERLRVENGRLFSRHSETSYSIGTFEMPSLGDLRQRADRRSGKLSLSLVEADARQLHRLQENAGATFQVASQFNMLEMTGPSVTPEHGVTRYVYDRTQGPACAIAAGAATIYRNYFIPVREQVGQTAHCQLDGLVDVGAALGPLAGMPSSELWRMENGYALPTKETLGAIDQALTTCSAEEIDELRSHLRVGLHADVEVTDQPDQHGQLVSQVFCSALPIAYSGLAASRWEAFARLILEAAYEATFLAALINAERTGSRKLYLTLVGAGAFGNPVEWVFDAISRSLGKFRNTNLDVAIVSFRPPSMELQRLKADFEAGK